MAELVAVLPEAPDGIEPTSVDNRRLFGLVASSRALEPEAPCLGGRSGSGLAARSRDNLSKRVASRLAEQPNGDCADLLTPADLYWFDPLVTLEEWARGSDRKWYPVKVGPSLPRVE